MLPSISFFPFFWGGNIDFKTISHMYCQDKSLTSTYNLIGRIMFLIFKCCLHFTLCWERDLQKAAGMRILTDPNSKMHKYYLMFGLLWFDASTPQPTALTTPSQVPSGIVFSTSWDEYLVANHIVHDDVCNTCSKVSVYCNFLHRHNTLQSKSALSWSPRILTDDTLLTGIRFPSNLYSEN